MTAEEWERIKAIFEAALALNSEERSAFLDSACVDRPDLREVVERLLDQYSKAGDFLEEEARTEDRILPAFAVNQLVAGRFRIQRLVASGGMGEVYEVFDERLRVRVALKTIRTDLGASKEAYERFKREVWVTREVAHEGICRVFELIEHAHPSRPDGTLIPCLTMKFLDGRNLQEHVNEERPMSPQRALPLIRQICEALHALHTHGILHRDLKPSNVMVVPGPNGSERAVLTDFGLARQLDTSFITTAAGQQKPGAPYFMAPETLKGETESVASDIYALGLVIDEMLTNRRAFDAGSIHALYYQKVWEEPCAPSERAPSLPGGWEQVILRCLAADPGIRYTSARDVAADLERSEKERPIARPSSKRQRFGGKRRIAFASFGLLLLLTVLLPVAVWSESPASMVVAPVTNETGIKDIDSLAAGTTMELMRRLTRLEGLRVYQLRGGPNEREQVRTEAQYLLSSELHGSINRIRLQTKLFETNSGKVLWTGEAERAFHDALLLQTDITDGLIAKLNDDFSNALTPTASPVSRVLPTVIRSWFVQRPYPTYRAPTLNIASFQKYMRAQMLFEERSPAAAKQAMDLLNSVVAEEPGFALAWTAMSDLQRLMMEHASDVETLQLRAQAREYAERAVTIDPSLPEAHATLAAVMQVEWEWQRADESYRLALHLHPKFARARRQYAGLLLQLGRSEEALRLTQEALQLDPLDYPTQSFYGFALLHSGRTLEAVQHLEQVVAKKDLLAAHIVLGQAYATLTTSVPASEAAAVGQKALREAALIEQREKQQGSASLPDPLKWSAMIYGLTNAYLGLPEQARPWLEQMERNRRLGRIPAYSVAVVYAAMKDYDRALDTLEMAAAYREKDLTNVKVAPYFIALHNNPRFRRLLATMRLPLT